MIVLLCVIFVASPALAEISKDTVYSCSLTEFMCSDGACISAEQVCNGVHECADASDEMACDPISYTSLSSTGHVLNRSRRQSTCRKNQFKCRDGSCISFDGKCDGVVDCPDGSDETHALCRKTQCQSIWFRCTYGACVDGTAPCNGLQECADNSDELLPRCRNETDEVRGRFKCEDGSFISAANHCDGTRDCADGSDETVRACAGKTCPSYLFQCAYGACVDAGADCNKYAYGTCVDAGADCNKIHECADGSDEAHELCGTSASTVIKPTTGNCVLPPYPEHGTYVTNVAGARPGAGYKYVTLEVSCQQGYGVLGSKSVSCQDGVWRESVPKCVRQCRLDTHPSVEYRCVVSGDITGTRRCENYEPAGTIVIPECRKPNYYSPTTLTFMRCIDGYWDYTARCTPECGKVTPDGIELVVGGLPAKKGELPWHAGIYKKTYKPYMQVCGGSLISSNIIISAAHCFWTDLEKLLPTSQFAVAVGKIYRPWNDSLDDAQKSDVKKINLPPRYQGAGGNFQDDIAVVEVTTAFVYKTFIRPVCMSFDINFERQQLQANNKGKVAGWGLTAENGKASPVLQVIDLPYVEIGICIANSPPNFREYITSDKICAGTLEPNSALCKGDSGGGLAFPTTDKGTERFYLRGIVSTAPNNENACNTATYTSFTQIMLHEHFIKQFWTEN